MKRLLLFVLLFGAGLAVLLYLRDERPDAIVAEGERPLDDTSGLVDVPDDPTAPQDGSSQIGVSAELSFTYFDKLTGETQFVLEAADSRTSESGWLELEDVTLSYPGIGVVTAERGRIAVDPRGGLLTGDAAATGGRIELESSVFELDEAQRMAPATVRAPRFEANYDTQVVTLLGGPTWTSDVFVVRGARIDVDFTNERIVATESTRAEWLDENGATGLDLTAERLEIEAADPLRVEVLLTADARVAMAPRDPLEEQLVLVAPTIGLVGARADEDAAFTPTEVRIEDGRGTLSSGALRVSGESFGFAFEGQPRPQRITVSGAPELVLPPELWSTLDPDGRLDPSVWGALVLTAADELELGGASGAERVAIAARGASRLTLGELVMTAGDGFEGTLERATGAVHLAGAGGVAIDGQVPGADGPLEIEHRSDALVVDYQVVEEGDEPRQELALSTSGPAVFAASSLAGGAAASEHARFEAQSGIELTLASVRDEVSWQLERGGDITFDVTDGVRALRGSADWLADLDLATETLRGQGLAVDGRDDKGRDFAYAGDEVVAAGLEAITLTGAARFAGAGFELRANELARTGTDVSALGSVAVSLELPERRATFGCETLEVQGFVLEPGAGDATELRAERVLARGAVTGEGGLRDTRFDFEADELELFDWGSDEVRVEVRGAPFDTITEGDGAWQARFGLVRPGHDWTVRARRITATDRTLETDPASEPDEELHQLELVAEGDLEVEDTVTAFVGRGERLTLRDGVDPVVILESAAQPAFLRGSIATGSDPTGGDRTRAFEGTVRRAELRPDAIELIGIDGVLRGFKSPTTGSVGDMTLRAASLVSKTETWVGGLRDVLQVDGRVALSQEMPVGPGNTFRAEHITFVRFRDADQDPSAPPTELDTSFIAHGEVSMRKGTHFEAHGEHLEIAAPNQKLRFEGTPASILYAGIAVSSNYVTVDPTTMLVESGAGTVTVDAELMRALNESAPDVPWVLEHSGLEGRQEGDLVLEILQKPRLRVANTELTASVGLFWLDRLALESRRKMGREDLAVHGKVRDVFDNLPEDPASAIIEEVYFEGPVEYQVAGQTAGSADAMYLDLEDETGWLANAELFLQRDVRDRAVRWSARAEWMQRTSEGSLVSNDAVLSPCAFVDEHLRVNTESLVVRRAQEDDESSFRVNLNGNSLDAYGLLSIPLPPIAWDADEEGMPLVPELKLGSSARFGSFVQTGLSFDAENVGSGMHKLLGAGDEDRTKTDAHVGVSWLGSRGILLDVALELVAVDRYWLNLAIGGLLDDNEDKGLIQVDPSERRDLRTWFRARGRYDVDDTTWIDLVLSTESDPAVQSEFYEDEFLEYEERENYLHWRTSAGHKFLSAKLNVQVDTARTQVDELPSVRATIDRTAFHPFGDATTWLYSSNSTLGWYRRLAGDLDHQSPWALQSPFADGGGDAHVVRADSTHRFEAPYNVLDHWKLVPFLEARATLWSDNLSADDDPTRFDLEAGARLTTLYWNRWSSGTTAQVAPFLETRFNLAHETAGGTPALFDAVDLPTGDDRLAAGLRTRLFGWREGEELDFEVLFARLAPELGDDVETFETFAGWQTHVFDVPVGFSHDGRYELESGATLVSHSLMGLRPTDNLGIELGHSRATDAAGLPYYESGTVRGVYRWTEKWEFEASQTLSVLEDTDLRYETILRRYGHDLVFEIGLSRIAGEGGTTFTMKVRPELLFRRSEIGYAAHR